MTLYDGSVEQMVSQNVKLRVDSSFLEAVTKDILRALMYLASQGLIHRDVKPDNILVESMVDEGSKNKSAVIRKYVLADFGSSKVRLPQAALLADSTNIKTTRIK